VNGLTTLRQMARNKGGADDHADPAAGPPEPQPEEPATGAGPAVPAATAAAPPAAPAAPAGPPADAAARPRPPLVVLREGHKVTLAEQARAVLGVTWRQARRNLREMRKHPGGLIRHLFSVQGPSVDDQIDYKQEQRYLPAGYDEDSIPALAGDLYHEWIGIPGTAAGQAWLGLVTRPLRAGIAFFLAYVPVCLLLIIVGAISGVRAAVVVGVGMLAGLAIAVIVALIGLEAWSSARRRAKQPPPPDDDEEDRDGDGPDPGSGPGYY
jgi:hypothetical protein